MKLIELVSENIIRWPEGVHALAQEKDGHCFAYGNKAPDFDVLGWSGDTVGLIFEYETAEDYATTYVTEPDWLAWVVGVCPPGGLYPAGMEHTTEAPPLPDDQVPPATMDLVTAGARLAEIAAELIRLKTERDAIGAIVTAAGFTFEGAEYARPLRDLADVKAGMLVDMVNPRIDSDPCRVVVSWIYDGKIGYVYPDGDEYSVMFDDEGVSIFARPN